MGYVPGLTNDVFISYSHFDESSGWVTRFHDELATQLEELLGSVAIWRDVRLQASEDFPQSIQDALTGTGVFLAIVSPNYLRSKYCFEKEVPFFESVVGPSGMKVGNFYRIVKAIKRPAPANRHQLWLPDSLGVPFWKSDSQSESIQELRVGTKGFKDAVARVAQSVAQTLTDVRNARLPVYIAKPSADLDNPFETLRRELHARGYRILPSDRIWTENAISEEIGHSALSVHLFGTQFDRFVSRQAELARERDIPMLLWLNPDARNVYSEAVRALEEYPRLAALIEKTPDFKLPSLIEQYVQRRSEPPPPEPEQTTRVFILCESRQEQEWQFASQLTEQILTIPGFEVDTPDPLATNVWQDREKKLRRADGVVVYWDTTDERWLTYAQEDLREMALRRNREYRSQAIVLGAQRRSTPVQSPIVVERQDPFDIRQLKPFFDQLRGASTRLMAS